MRRTVAKKLLEHAEHLPEGAPLCAKGLLHLGNRAALDQALSRLAHGGQLLKVGRGVYVRPVESRFGVRPPSAEKVVEGIARIRGETVASHGAAAANALGLTTQVPVRTVYLTSGRSRRLRFGAEVVELKHAPPWQLAKAGTPAGEALRALVWLGPAHAIEALTMLKQTLAAPELREIVSAQASLPGWLAATVSATLATNA